jgi:Ser-tRNA(Ala) deacylase AlaX
VFETDSSRIVISLHEKLRSDKTEKVVKRLASSLSKEIETLYPLKGKIALVKEQEVLLNIGSDTGVSPRIKFAVLSGKEITGTGGKHLGYDDKEIGMIKITKVQERISHAKIRRHKEPLKKGMRVREIVH